MKKLVFLMLLLGIISGAAIYTSNLIGSNGDDEDTAQYSDDGDCEANVDQTCPPAE